MNQNDDRGQLPNLFEQAAFLAWFFRLIAGSLGAMVLPFLRRRIGGKFIILRGIVGCVIFLLYGLAVSPQDTTVYSIGCMVWIVMALLSTTPPDGLLHGKHVHSQYTGWPRLCDWFSVSETTAKAALEPMVIGIAGVLVMVLNEPLGVFIMLSGVGGFLDFAIIQDLQLKRLRQMRDSEIESESIWDSYEERYGRN